MKINKKTKVGILASTLAIAVICVGIIGTISIKGSNKESSVKIAKVASTSDYNMVTLEK